MFVARLGVAGRGRQHRRERVNRRASKKTPSRKQEIPAFRLNAWDYVFWGLILLGLVVPFLSRDVLAISSTALVALTLLSMYMGKAVESLAYYYSDMTSGFLMTLFGNFAELVIGFAALQAGLGEVVKASITGSILGNILVVFGSGVLIAGLKYKSQKLPSAMSDTNSTLLLTTVLLFLFPSLLPYFHEVAFEENISLYVGVLMLLIYVASLLFSFVTHKEWFLSREKEVKAELSRFASIALLVVVSILMFVVSESFVGVIEELSKNFGWNNLFIGVVIIGLVGNVAEHIVSIELTLKNKVALLLSSSVGSSLQVALFVMPLLVITGYAIGKPVTLLFTPLEIASLIGTALLVNEISKDGKVNWFEGLLLLILYAVVGALFFYAR